MLSGCVTFMPLPAWLGKRQLRYAPVSPVCLLMTIRLDLLGRWLLPLLRCCVLRLLCSVLVCSGSFFCCTCIGLAEDDQDSVRLQTVDNCSALARVMPPEGQKEHVLPVVLDTTKDK